MLLLHPEAAVLQEVRAFVISPGHQRFFAFSPGGTALGGGHFGMLKNLVLIFVHAAQIRNDAQAVAQVCIAVIFCVLAEEQIHIRIGQKFHGHGVNLVDLAGGPDQIHGGHAFCRGKRFKSMARLMREHIDIGGGAVEIGEDERRAVCRQIGAVAAHMLAGAGA